MDNLIVLNNEKISEKNGNFYCRNFNFKILPEGLNKFFNVKYIARKSKTDEHHKLDLPDVKIASNIFQFIYFVISTFKKKKYKILYNYNTIYILGSFIFISLKRKYLYIL